MHDLLKLILHVLDIIIILVVSGTQVGLVVLNNINIAILSILPRHNLYLLLRLEALAAAVEGYEVFFLSDGILQLALLLRHLLLKHLSLVIINITELCLNLVIISRLDLQVVHSRILQRLLRHQRHPLHLVARPRLLLLILIPRCRANDDFGFKVFGGWTPLIRHL